MHSQTNNLQTSSSHPAEAQSAQPNFESSSLHSAKAQPAQPNLNHTISWECLVITNLFHTGTICKAAAILQIQGQLNDTDEHY